MNYKNLELKDGGQLKKFLIAKHKAIPALRMIKSIACLFSNGGIITKENILKYLGGTLSFSGENTDSNIDFIDLIEGAISGALSDGSDNIINDILDNIFLNVSLDVNGTKINTGNGLYDQLEDVNTILSLSKEVLILNFGYFFSEEKKS